MSGYINFIDDALSYVSVNPTQALAAAMFAMGVCSVTVLWNSFKKWRYARKMYKRVNSFLQNHDAVSTVVLSLLRKYLYSMNASRIMIFKYHNGDDDFRHFGSYSKMSCTYEVTAPGFKLLRSLYQNLPLSAYALITENMFTKGEMYVTDILKIRSMDRSTYEAAIKNRARCFCMHALKNTNHVINGFICLEFNRPVSFTQRLKAEVDILVEQISSALNSELQK